jgi:hypothetical protein
MGLSCHSRTLAPSIPQDGPIAHPWVPVSSSRSRSGSPWTTRSSCSAASASVTWEPRHHRRGRLRRRLDRAPDHRCRPDHHRRLRRLCRRQPRLLPADGLRRRCGAADRRHDRALRSDLLGDDPPRPPELAAAAPARWLPRKEIEDPGVASISRPVTCSSRTPVRRSSRRSTGSTAGGSTSAGTSARASSASTPTTSSIRPMTAAPRATGRAARGPDRHLPALPGTGLGRGPLGHVPR